VLADQVHRRGRVAGPAQQAGGAAHHFHAVIQGQVQAGIAVAPVLHHLRGQAIELVAVDVEAAGVELGAFGIGLGAADAGGVGQHVEDVVQVLIFDALVADDAHRLRDLARRQVEAGAGRGLAHGVAFGALALDHDLVQGGGVGRGVLCERGGSGQRAQRSKQGLGQAGLRQQAGQHNGRTGHRRFQGGSTPMADILGGPARSSGWGSVRGWRRPCRTRRGRRH